MTIVKKGSWLNGGSFASNVPVRRSTGKPVGNGSSFWVSSSDSSESESFEPVDGHVCQAGDQVCELPFELFDAPDLTQILSLDAWNHSLNDEEREVLAAYLPCMDEGTFRLTLKQLFAGENFNFSSPVADLFQMLKSGECNPKSARYRNGLMCFQRSNHEHEIRAYHNAMVNRLFEMQSLWQDYSDLTIAERLEMWKTLKGKGVKLTSQFFAEKRAGPLQNQHYKSLLKRKESYLKAKEDALAAQLMATSVVHPDVDSKAFALPRKYKREPDPSAYGSGSVVEKGKKAHPKGVLKLLPKPVARSNGITEMAPSNECVRVAPSSYQEAESSFEDKLYASPAAVEPTISPPVEWSSASSVKERAEFKSKSEKRLKGTGVKKFLAQGNDCVAGLHRDLNGDMNTELPEQQQRQHLVDFPHISTMQEVQAAPFLSVATEEVGTSPSGFNLPGTYEHKGKVKRRIKPKDREPVENGGARVLLEVNSIEDAYLAEKEVHDILDDKEEIDLVERPVKRRKKKLKADVDSSLPPFNGNCLLNRSASSAKVSRKHSPSVPPLALSFPFSTIHLLSSVRSALTAFSSERLMAFETEKALVGRPINDEDYLLGPKPVVSQQNRASLQGSDGLEIGKESEEKNSFLPSVPVPEIVRKVQAHPGDLRILETREPLQGLIRGVLKVLSSKVSHPGMKGWKPLVMYSRVARGWTWIGPVSSQSTNIDSSVVQISAEAWMIPPKMLYKLQELFCNWLKHEQEILQQLGQLALASPLTSPMLLDEKERFRELRAQKSLITINPTSEEMRVYFRREEALRYSVPDRAFSYTCLDGRKSAVAPLRRIGGKPNSKARDHFMLKSDRPPHVTILCLVRDAAARLPGGIGTRADVCSLIRDSQYIVEDVSDPQLNQVVSGALDRLHYERDPCVRFDGDRKLWVYLHTDKDDEDFEDDATSSTKRWRRTKRDGNETLDFDFPGRDDQDSNGLGLDFSPTSCFGGPNDLSSVYSSTVRNDLPYSHPNGSLTSPLALESAFSGSGRDDSLLHFIELPPSIQPPCVNMQQSHPMGWEVLSNRWDQDVHFQSHDKIVQEDFGGVASMASSHRESELLIDGGV
ncbi:hypothetical protein L7F22_054954 [Adiantum nelumboides]|nr:hypothetical protein [Adiantum nelumboides]